jgi:primase-polymerase (primpol)-like protein
LRTSRLPEKERERERKYLWQWLVNKMDEKTFTEEIEKQASKQASLSSHFTLHYGVVMRKSIMIVTIVSTIAYRERETCVCYNNCQKQN